MHFFAGVNFLIEKIDFLRGFSRKIGIHGCLKFSLRLGDFLFFFFFELDDEILDVFEIFEGLPCTVLFGVVFPLHLVLDYTFLTHTLI